MFFSHYDLDATATMPCSTSFSTIKRNSNIAILYKSINTYNIRKTHSE